MNGVQVHAVELVLFSHQDTAHYKITDCKQFVSPTRSHVITLQKISTQDIKRSSFRLREVEGQ